MQMLLYIMDSCAHADFREGGRGKDLFFSLSDVHGSPKIIEGDGGITDPHAPPRTPTLDLPCIKTFMHHWRLDFLKALPTNPKILSKIISIL